MKLLYIVLIIIFFSCTQKKKEKKESLKTEVKDAVEMVVEPVEAAAKTTAKPEKKVIHIDSLVFKKILKSTQTKALPIVDSTNFSNFKKEQFQFLIKEEINALQLENIYPNFYKEGYRYRAAISYKINFFDDFYTLVVTILKGTTEIESLLINYSRKDYKLLDGRVITLDAGVNGLAEKMTKINDKYLIKVNTFSYKDPYRQLLWLFEIASDTGKIISIPSSNSIFVEELLELQMEVNRLQIKEEFVATQVFFDKPENSILLIPEIEEEQEGYFALNNHIFLVDNKTKEINTKFYESHQNSDWVSDAIRLTKIEIDKNFYTVTNNITAFAVKTKFEGMSRANPYYKEMISLFIKSGNTLKKVLHNYTVNELTGKSNGNCESEYNEVKKIISTSNEKNNGYYNFLVTEKITKSIEFKNDLGDCDTNESSVTKTLVLTFDGELYKEQN